MTTKLDLPNSTSSTCAAGWTRRRAIRIVAACAGLPAVIAALRAMAPTGQLFDWHGEVLGALSQVTLWHTDAATARGALVKMQSEIARYERIFSLADPDSDISRLNTAGALDAPARELVALIEEGARFSLASGGAFDISVQPLWRLYEAHFWTHSEVQRDIRARAQAIASALVDFRGIDAAPRRVTFARPGMGITLNSLAQGYITDAIADLFRNEGFEHAMVDLGEFHAIGRHPDGRPWRIEINNGPVDGPARTIELEDSALAVSGGYGTTFEPTGEFHHIFNPHTGASASALIDAAVTGARATTANGLATALCVAGEAAAPALLAAHPGARAMLTRPDGTRVTVTALGTSV